MKIGIIYGTNSGGTREVAYLIRTELEARNNIVEMVDAKDATPATFTMYESLVIGSCTWELVTKERRFEGTLQEHWLALRNALRGHRFKHKPIAVFGLGDSSYTAFCSAANHLEALVKQLEAVQVGPTLRINEFYFHLNDNRRKIRDWATVLAHEFAKVTA